MTRYKDVAEAAAALTGDPEAATRINKLIEDYRIAKERGWTPCVDQFPEVGQKVIYHYQYIGTWRGEYFDDVGMNADPIADSKGFICESGGFIDHYGCFWMPDEGQELASIIDPPPLFEGEL